MKYLLAFLLGLGVVSVSACRSQAHAPEMQAETIVLSVSGMT